MYTIRMPVNNKSAVYIRVDRTCISIIILCYIPTRDAAKREMFIIACYTRAFLEFSSPVAPAIVYNNNHFFLPIQELLFFTLPSGRLYIAGI